MPSVPPKIRWFFRVFWRFRKKLINLFAMRESIRDRFRDTSMSNKVNKHSAAWWAIGMKPVRSSSSFWSLARLAINFKQMDVNENGCQHQLRTPRYSQPITFFGWLSQQCQQCQQPSGPRELQRYAQCRWPVGTSPEALGTDASWAQLGVLFLRGD